MPLWFLDEAGSYVGENSTAYPAPAEMVERIRANLPAGVARIEDVPPLTGEFWPWPPRRTGGSSSRRSTPRSIATKLRQTSRMAPG
ncbi:hypothetical protein [Enterovirga sp. CN4-39]|uniref:hypothetical protein n=1 Tax=Enterovirga sp. CN4-39 TaxID=3400910 RepID=UPI003C022194